MNVELSGIHTVRKRLADGSERTYHYAWRGGPRLPDDSNSPAFVAAYATAHERRREAASDTFGGIIARYKASHEFRRLSPRTQQDYRKQIAKIEITFGDMPREALDDPRVRKDFLDWRNSMATHPKQADYALTVLRLLLSWAKGRGDILYNHTEKLARPLYHPDRSECIWLPEHVNAFLAVTPPELRLPLWLAHETGQRQGDLLRLPWSAYDGETITLRQGKGGRRVVIPVTAKLRPIVDAAPRVAPLILTDKNSRPWSGERFRKAWGRASKAAGIDRVISTSSRGEEIVGLHFHDLRGTAVTSLAEAECELPEIVAITGHSMKQAQVILERYLARTPKLALAAIRRLDAHRAERGL